MFHAGRKSQPNVPDIWVGDPLLVHSFVLPSVFCSFLLPPYALQLLGLGWMVLSFAPIRFFLRSFLLVSFHGIVACRPRGSLIRYM